MPALGVDVLASPGLGLSILAAAGVLAGIINALAGGGSFLILPLLIGLGLPPTVANGTSRVGVVVQCLSSSWTFHSRGVRDYGITVRLALPITLGALAGAYLATRFDDTLLRPVIGVVLVVWGLILGFRPGRFLEPPEEPSSASWRSDFGGLVIGLYGGFLQAGVGFPLLALLIPALGYHAVVANAIKSRLVLIYSLLALPIFAMAGQIVWREGLVLGAGTMVGGWLGARLQLRSGAGIVRWAVLIMVLIGGIALLVTG